MRDSTKIQHRTALGRVLPLLGSLPVEEITVDDVQRMVDVLTAEGKARESIRKSKTALAMILDHVAIEPNPARSKRVKLPLEEPEEVEPPIADHVEEAAWMLAPSYVLGVLVLDATGARIGELEAATIGDLDESRKSWLVRAKIAKTRKARWVELPDDLYDAVCGLLPAREDRELEAPLFPIGSADRLRMAIGRACRDAGVPSWSPHHLWHRRISLLHHEGESWAEIGPPVLPALRATRLCACIRGRRFLKLLGHDGLRSAMSTSPLRGRPVSANSRWAHSGQNGSGSPQPSLQKPRRSAIAVNSSTSRAHSVHRIASSPRGSIGRA